MRKILQHASSHATICAGTCESIPPRGGALILRHRPRLGRLHAFAATLLCLGLPACWDDPAGLPPLTAVQAAYDSAKLESEETHDDQLLIRQAACHRLGSEKVACQISFTDQRSTSGRLFYDVVGLDRAGDGWRLVSGLCRG